LNYTRKVCDILCDLGMKAMKRKAPNGYNGQI